MKQFEKIEKYQKAMQIIKDASKDNSFCIDGNSEKIGDIELKDITNIEFTSNDTKDELILVRTDERFPEEGKVKTPIQGGALDGTGKAYINRNTSHWCLNGMVSDHSMGTFSGRDFVILQSFKDLESRLAGFNVVDTYFEDGVTLSNDAIVLVRENRMKDITEEMKNGITVIPFKGDESIATNKALIMLGKKPQKIETHSWGSFDTSENPNMSKVYELARKENYPQKTHFYTIEGVYTNEAVQRDKYLFDMRGKITDTRFENAKITLEELENLFENLYQNENRSIDNLEDFYDFAVKYGINVTDNGEYEIMNANDAINQIKEYSLDKDDGFCSYRREGKEDFKNQHQKLLHDIEENRKKQLEEEKIKKEQIENEKREIVKKKQVKDLLAEEKKIFSDLTYQTIDEANTDESLNVTDSMVLYADEDKVMEMVGKSNHFTTSDGFEGPEVYTDFNKEVENETVEQYLERLSNYISNTIRLYNGEDISFDRDGNIIQSKQEQNTGAKNTDLWINRFHGWYSIMDRLPEDAKKKFVPVRGEMIKSISITMKEKDIEKHQDKDK